jgi:anthranilate phosphoribosyltransferase
MKDLLHMIKSGALLSENQIQEALQQMTSGRASPAQTGAFLMGLASRGETASEIAAAADFLRQHADKLSAPQGTVDCCGTGGDIHGTYNISTAVALVCAACSVPVAKHGNRAASSKSGAADVLEALGTPLNVPKQRLEQALKKYYFAFLMAPSHHQVLKPLAPIRKDLGFQTIFNLLGPLASPADTKFQLIGVFDQKWGRVFAEALHKLGSKRAWIVHGRDGLDEITLSDDTDITILHEDGRIEERVLSPHDFGLPACQLEELKGGEAKQNADALYELLNGKPSAYRNVVVANAAAVLVISTAANDLKDGVQQAQDALDQHKALKLLENYIAFVSASHD